MSGSQGMSPMGSIGARGALSPSGPGMDGGQNPNNQRFGSATGYTPNGQ